MKELHLHTSSIFLFEQFANLKNYIGSRKAVIVTDETVKSFYSDAFPTLPVITIKQGEKNKTLEAVQTLYQHFLDEEIDRSSLIVAVGGGIVCDIVGFAAATYMRGISCGFVPTTLLAQVDASIGGKNGVNLNSLKNMVGTFTHPEFVLIDPQFLQTLPPRHIQNGFIEMIKHSIIQDAELFDFINENKDIIADTTSSQFHYALEKAVAVKIAVVSQDEKESGMRKILNFGHTIGHAIEAIDTTILHGEAVAAGIIYATQLAQIRGVVSHDELEKIKALISSFVPQIPIDMKKIAPLLFADKKRAGSTIDFIFPNGIGNAKVVPLTVAEILSSI
ncbi:3-dehydroquinate synthase [bacterium]|nr:3-dehydroquinate synthase [bacterium]